MGKILALDFGTKRIGHAVSDIDRTMAFPRDVLPRIPKTKLFEKLEKIVKEEGIQKIVIGVPLDIENEETVLSALARKFGDDVGRKFMLPIVYIDESASTDEALKKIPIRKLRSQKGFKDAIAAQIILQRYLDKR